ncbi:uncharacterized protein [Linepithema humile]|uniref:uncharacterized protein n=1 Tax=Linepithema humile TaxID=83485 RepID=UPI0006234908|nr:PREDICTED: uncharacterized protein LOC105672108 [Linepithema humile]
MNRHSAHPTESLYDEILHEIDNNVLSIKIPKDRRRIQTVNGQAAAEPASTIDARCFDKYGKKCKKSCPKVSVKHNQTPPPKKPEEEMLLLKTIRQITPTGDMKHSLEVEFKSPRNYIPLPEPGPSPPIIVPKEPIIVKKLENKDKKKVKQ